MPNVEDSILLSVKKALGMGADYTPFDPDIMMHLNSFIGALYQIGVNSAATTFITDEETLWTDLIPEGDTRLAMIKTYLYAKVRMVFDPPTSTAQMQALKEAASELEFRIEVASDKPYDDLVIGGSGTSGSGGTMDHNELINRDAPDQHPIAAITDLKENLDDKISTRDRMTIAEIDQIMKGG